MCVHCTCDALAGSWWFHWLKPSSKDPHKLTNTLSHAEHVKSMDYIFLIFLAEIMLVCWASALTSFTIMMYCIVFLLRFVISFATIMAQVFEHNLKFKRYNLFSLAFRLTDFFFFQFCGLFRVKFFRRNISRNKLSFWLSKTRFE